jgi:hypothetical protein
VPTSSYSLRNDGSSSNQIEYEALWITRF